MPQEVVQKLPTEFLLMLQKTREITSEIEVRPLRTYRVEVVGASVLLADEPQLSR